MLTDHELLIRHLMHGLVDPATRLVRFTSLQDLDHSLRRFGFVLGWSQPYPPPGNGPPHNGTMLFYWCALGPAGRGFGVRIKTHGERLGSRRAGRPHLSTCWFEGGVDFDRHEQFKYTIRGVATHKSPKGSGMSAAQADAWADETHFMFPGFGEPQWPDPSGLEGAHMLRHLNAQTLH